MTAGSDRPGGVEEDRVAPCPACAREDVADRLGAVRRRGAAESVDGAPLDTELGARIELTFGHPAVDHLGDEIRSDRGELVDAAGSVHDVRAARTEPGE